jgi:hypothetical protein
MRRQTKALTMPFTGGTERDADAGNIALQHFESIVLYVRDEESGH